MAEFQEGWESPKGHQPELSFIDDDLLDVSRAMEAVKIKPVENERLLVTPVEPKCIERVTQMVDEFKRDFPDRLVALDEAIHKHHRNNVQKLEDVDLKLKIRDELMKVVKRAFGNSAMLVVVGSTAQNLCDRAGDLDLCLCVLNKKNEMSTNRERIQEYLNTLYEELVHNRPKHMVCFSRIIVKAVVPIVKVYLNGDYKDMNIDINCNNMQVFFTNHLIQHYVLFDRRVQPLTIALKHWAEESEILDSMHGKLNSFSFVMMVIHYLQCVCSPPVLPNLSALFPSIFRVSSLKNFRMPENHEFCIPKDFKEARMEPNTQSVGELFLGFIAYYSKFNWEQLAISVRQGNRYERLRQTESEEDRTEMFIEEPTELFNTTRNIRFTFNRWDIEKTLKALANDLFNNHSKKPADIFAC